MRRILRATGSPDEEIRSILNKNFEIPITIASKLIYSEDLTQGKLLSSVTGLPIDLEAKRQQIKFQEGLDFFFSDEMVNIESTLKLEISYVINVLKEIQQFQLIYQIKSQTE